jgi:hypothetical protein
MDALSLLLFNIFKRGLRTHDFVVGGIMLLTIGAFILSINLTLIFWASIFFTFGIISILLGFYYKRKLGSWTSKLKLIE